MRSLIVYAEPIDGGRSYYDDFLAFPPEYVALLGLGLLFIILFIIVVIIICVTARVSLSVAYTMC